jgi:hypothetical protein
MKLKPFARFFYDPVYRVNYFTVCCRPEKYQAELVKAMRASILTKSDRGEILRKCPLDAEGCAGRTFRLEAKVKTRVASVVIVWLRPGSDVTTVAHEAWHAVIWVFLDRGVKFHDSSEEAVAYYHQWIMRATLGIRL